MNGPYRVLHISLGVNFHPHEHPSDLGHFVENGAFNSGTKTNQWPAHIHAEYHLRPLSVPSGGTILPTFGWGKQSVWLTASGCQRSSGRKPGPTVLPEKRKAGASGGTGGVIPPCCPCTAPCVAVDRRTAVSQQTRMSPLWNPCRRRVRPKS